MRTPFLNLKVTFALLRLFGSTHLSVRKIARMAEYEKDMVLHVC